MLFILHFSLYVYALCFFEIFNAALRKILFKFLPSTILTTEYNLWNILYSNDKYIIEAVETKKIVKYDSNISRPLKKTCHALGNRKTSKRNNEKQTVLYVVETTLSNCVEMQ